MTASTSTTSAPACPVEGCPRSCGFTWREGRRVFDPACCDHILDVYVAPGEPVLPVAEPVTADTAAPTVLEEAAELVDGPRRHTYGHPRDNHERTAALWSAYLGVPISARQVCMLNALQKVGRDAHRPWRDNLVDLAGWARNAEMCSEDTGQGGGAWESAT